MIVKLKRVYVVTGKGKRKFWTEIGKAFFNKDGSITCKLDSLPINGEIHILDESPSNKRLASSDEEWHQCEENN